MLYIKTLQPSVYKLILEPGRDGNSENRNKKAMTALKIIGYIFAKILNLVCFKDIIVRDPGGKKQPT